MKTLFIHLLLGATLLCQAQGDSTTVTLNADSSKSFKTYPFDFPKSTFRFKPFLVSQSALAAEYEIYGTKRSRSTVIGFEATLLQSSDSEVRGGAIELENRTYFDRSVYSGDNDEMLFYISYGIKFGTYDLYSINFEGDYIEYDDPSTQWTVETKWEEVESVIDESFNRLFVNLKVGLQYVAFKKISLDMNVGAGLWYNSKFIDKVEVYDNYSVQKLLKKGIHPTIHLAIGLAN